MKQLLAILSLILVGYFSLSCEDLIGLERLNIVKTEAINGSNFVPEDTTINAYVESFLIDVGDRKPLIRYGHCWARTPEPVIEIDNFSINLSPAAPRAYIDTLNRLELDSTYFIRAYAEFEGGIVYGETIEFIADASDVPVAEFGNTDIGTTSVGFITQPIGTPSGENVIEVEASIELISLGIRPIIAHGFCWAIEPNPTVENADTTNLGSLSEAGEISDTLSVADTPNIYLRSYVISSSGTPIYGGDGDTQIQVF